MELIALILGVLMLRGLIGDGRRGRVIRKNPPPVKEYPRYHLR